MKSLNSITELKKKIKSKKFCVGVVGLGYVGLPLCKIITESKISCIGFDISKKIVDKINLNKSPQKQFTDIEIKKMKKNFYATTSLNSINACDLIILCLPTPITSNKEPDLSSILQTLKNIQPYLRKFQTISLESTTWPGTTREIIQNYIKNFGYNVGKDFFIVYSPEREDPGNLKFKNKSIPKLISGVTHNCLDIGISFYQFFIETLVRASSTDTAEITKLFENIYRSVNIGLVNELKILTEKLDLDIFEIIKLASTKPFGFKAFYPGPGVGGHCIPVDPYYLSWKAKEFNFHTKFIELAAEINNNMPFYVVNKIINVLNENNILIKKSSILLIGMAYKKDSDDIRESPSLPILEMLKSKGSNVDFYDPYVKKIGKLRKFTVNKSSVSLTKSTIRNFDLIVILTNHTTINYNLIEKNSKLIIDTRGVLKKSSKVFYA